ncbi:hypothetical protein HKX48_002264 [Thoreauomyces humboldtii]|nr:hypothetical protein HKX48_002264 [Thoreauomyces humboldtii]
MTSRNCATNYVAGGGVDYFANNKATTRTGSKVSITYPAAGNYKVVTDNISNLSYVLYQCGTTPPTGITPAPAATIEVPIQSIGTSDTTQLGYLELLGARSSIQFSPDSTLITSPCMLRAKAAGLADAPASYNQTDATWVAKAATVNMTLIDPATYVPAGDKFVVFPASSDVSALGRPDWLQFLAAFYNQETLANALVANITSDYNCVKTAAAASASALGSPNALWADYYSPTVYIGSSYLYTYLADAGAAASQISAANTGAAVTPSTAYNISVAADKTTLSTIFTNAEIYFSASLSGESDLYSWAGASATTLKNYNVTRTGEVWAADKSTDPLKSADDFYASGIVDAHIVLADMASIIQPALLPGYTRTYFRDVASGEAKVAASASSCTDAEYAAGAPLPLPRVTCPSALTATSANAILWNGAGAATLSSFGMQTVPEVAPTLALVAVLSAMFLL